MPHPLRNTAINLLVLAGTIVMFFAACEIIVRMTGLVSLTPQPPQIYENVSDLELGYALRPSIQEKAYRTTVTTNSLGLRGPEVDTTKPVMAVLGDSITFGYGLEDDQSLPARLQASLPEWSVVNGAVPGYTLGQEAALYQARIAALQPKSLVLVFYFNDLDDQRPPVLDAKGIIRQPGWEESGEPDCNPITKGILRWTPGQCWLSRNSAFFLGVRKFLSARQEHRNLEAQQEEYRQNLDDDVPQERLDAYATVFKRFTATLPAQMPKLFVIWPEKHVHHVIRPKLKALAESQGFTVLDLYDTFGNTPESLSWDTVHPSAATVERAAKVIVDAL